FAATVTNTAEYPYVYNTYGHAWSTTDVASEYVAIYCGLIPVTGATVSSKLQWSSNSNFVTTTDIMDLNSTGDLNLKGGLTLGDAKDITINSTTGTKIGQS